MLMGHPLLYAPPELHLAQYRNLRARERSFTENDQYWQVMGVVQTLAHLNGWSKWQAFHYMSRLTRRDVPVAEVYRLCLEVLTIVHSRWVEAGFMEKGQLAVGSRPWADSGA